MMSVLSINTYISVWCIFYGQNEANVGVVDSVFAGEIRGLDAIMERSSMECFKQRTYAQPNESGLRL